MSALEEYLLVIASRELGYPAPSSTRDAIRESIDSHHLWEASDWLLPLLRRLIDGALTAEPVEIPSGYPYGENAFANLLLDLASEAWLDVDDYGEGLRWRLPVAGLELFVSREYRSDMDIYSVRRAAT
jgi:hypothetical protein